MEGVAVVVGLARLVVVVLPVWVTQVSLHPPDRIRSEAGMRGFCMRKPALYTIGHLTRPIDECLALLEAHRIENAVDVRTIPHSRHNPQYDQTALRRALKAARIRYQHMPRLGGLRHARKDSQNTGWINAAFRGVADHMQSKDSQDGLRRLEAEARKRATAIRCAEAFVARCHRSLIADALAVDGWRVLHIQSRKTATAHRRRPVLKATGAGQRSRRAQTGRTDRDQAVPAGTARERRRRPS